MSKYYLFILLCYTNRLTAQEQLQHYSKFDFVAGEKIIYINNFENEAIGEMPLGWNTNGSGEVVNLKQDKWLKINQNSTLITDNSEAFSDQFSVEFDVLLDFKFQDALFPAFSFGIFSSGQESPNSNRALMDIFNHTLVSIDVNAGIEQNSIVKLITTHNEQEYFNSGEKQLITLEKLLGKIIHFSLQVNKNRLRIWMNESKLFDAPQAIPNSANLNQLYFRMFESSYSNNQIGIYLSNIKIAKGLDEIKNKLLKEGKYVTNAILFQKNSAEVQASSMGVLSEIARLINEQKGSKFLIIGHTDSDGNETDNLILSQKRSEAVKQILITQFLVDPSTLLVTGKGEHEPLNNNSSLIDKAQNRRVEFIKQ